MRFHLFPKNNFFSFQDLYRLILPLIIEQALAVSVGIVDSMMVSSVGEIAISAVSLVDMISTLIINLLAAVSTGGSVVVSQLIGARQPRYAQEAADQLLLATTSISIIITVVLLLFHRCILSLLYSKISVRVMHDCIIYLLITVPSFPFLAIYNACSAVFRAQGNTKISIKSSLIMNLINLVGNSVCIYSFQLGIVGAALSTLVARISACVIIVISLQKWDGIRISSLLQIRPNRNLIIRIFSIGIPNGIENGIFYFGKILVVGIVSQFGTSQIAANSMSNNIVFLTILIGQAISLAVVTIVGYCVGAKSLTQAYHYGWLLTLLGSIFIAVSACFVILLLPILIRLYGASEEAAYYIRRIVPLHCIVSPILWSGSFILPGALRACNDVRFTALVSISSMWICRIFLSYILGVQFGFGVLGVWIAMMIDWVIRTLFYVFRFLSKSWEKYATQKLPETQQNKS